MSEARSPSESHDTTSTDARPDEVPSFGVGAVLYVAEADYIYGVGPLAMRVTEAEVNPAQHRAMEWVSVRGIEIHWNGATGAERFAVIRVAALRGALRPRNWLPPQQASVQPVRRQADPPRSPRSGTQ